MKTGTATVYANYIYNGKTDSNVYSVIKLSSGTANPPMLTVFNALIFNANAMAVNACVFFENTSGGTAVNKCMLTNCQVGNYSSALGAITCAISNNLGIGQITLNNTTIYCASVVPSLTDGFIGVPPAVQPNSGNVLRSFVYGVFASYTSNYVNAPTSQTVAGTITTNTSIIFNQGIPI
jgi:hypothetical protein